MVRIKQSYGPSPGPHMPNTPPKTPEPKADGGSTSSQEFAGPPNKHALQRQAQQSLQVPTPRSLSPADKVQRGPIPTLLAGCTKSRYDKSTYIGKVGMEVIHLLDVDQDTTRYFMSKAYEQGGFGKFKFGLSAQGKLVAVKEMRLAPSRNPQRASALGREKTKPMSQEQIHDEAGKTRLIRSAIDAHIQQDIRAHHGVDPLRHVRRGVTPFEVVETIQIQDKVHLVTSLEAGDVWSLHASLPLHLRGPVALSAGAQLFSELSAMHAAGHIHLDLKMENLLYNSLGQIKTADFGMTEETRHGVSARGMKGLLGSNFAPEMLPDVDARGHFKRGMQALSTATDVYAAAITVFEVLARRISVPNIFEPILDDYGDIDPLATKKHMVQFEVWRRQVVGADGKLNKSVLAERNAFSVWMTQCHVLMPGLVESLLAHALIADPTKRASATKMASILQTQVQNLRDTQSTYVRQFFSETAGVKHLDTVERKLRSYQNWHQTEHNGRVKPVYTMLR